MHASIKGGGGGAELNKPKYCVVHFGLSMALKTHGLKLDLRV